MNNIRMIYRYSEVEPSVFLLLYFRMLGIYITERFLDQTVDLTRQLSLLQDGHNMTTNSEAIVGEADIVLVNRQEDYYRARKYFTGNYILVAHKRLRPFGEDLDRTVWYSKDEENVLIYEILSLFKRLNIMSQEEYDDCKTVADIYVNCKFMQTTLSTKFFFIDSSPNWFKGNIEKYENTVDKLLEAWNGLQEGKRSKGLYEHLWYAVINTIYEANLYCKRSLRSFSYSVDNLLHMLQASIKNNILGISLKNSTYMLMGQIYDDLVENHNLAYEFYLKCCSNSDRHNAYVFMRKGQYWQEHAEQYETAIKYYFRSVTIFREYYRSWYRMGNAYYYLREYNKAYASYEAVIKILTGRLKAGQIRPLEIEHLFLAANQCARISMERRRDVGKAIDLLRQAERVWNEIDRSKFIDMMSTNDGEKTIFRNITKKKLNIGYVYSRLAELYGLCGLAAAADEYRRRSILLEERLGNE